MGFLKDGLFVFRRNEDTYDEKRINIDNYLNYSAIIFCVPCFQFLWGLRVRAWALMDMSCWKKTPDSVLLCRSLCAADNAGTDEDSGIDIDADKGADEESDDQDVDKESDDDDDMIEDGDDENEVEKKLLNDYWMDGSSKQIKMKDDEETHFPTSDYWSASSDVGSSQPESEV